MTSPRLALVLLFTAGLLACAAPTAPTAATPAPQAAATALPKPVPAVERATSPPDPRVLGLWIIEQARSAPLLDKRLARLDFRTDGAVVGHAGCNGFNGRYTLEGNQLRIGALATTRKSCGDALMEQEDRVLTALERAARATVPPHGFLTLHDGDGAVLMRASRIDAAN